MRRVLVSILGIAALFAAGCGDSGDNGEPIPARQADALLTQLDQVERLADDGKCNSARFQVTGDGQLEDKVGRLPDDTDPDVRSALSDGLDRLLELIDDECGGNREQTDTTETETQPAPPPETETQETETQPTETTPPPTETTPPPTETTPPPTETTPLPPGQGGGAAPDGGTPKDAGRKR